MANSFQSSFQRFLDNFPQSFKGVEKSLQGTIAIKCEKHSDNLKFSWLMTRGQLEKVLKF